MDYKELIGLSKKAAAEWQNTHEYYQAATLITALCEATETLLAEREAEIDDLKVECSVCKKYNIWNRFATGKCASCQTMRLCMMTIGNGFGQSIHDRQQTEIWEKER